MDLFTHASLQRPGSVPLSESLRPQSLDGIVGQDHALGPQSKLGQLIRQGHIPSLILWGPPGTGKTTFALALSKLSGAHFMSLNAVDAGSKALREAGEEGRQRRLVHGQKTLLFVDEIHRFNRGQQDVLLPHLEKGDLILIGATTENPSYELNRALLSRCRVLVFRRLTEEALEKILQSAFSQSPLPLVKSGFFTPEAHRQILEISDGDARRLLNGLEVLFAASGERSEPWTPEDMRALLQETPLAHDKSSEMHYDVISAFIKSVRGSDPDAAVYYLARLVEGGEDPVFIARRLIILASEDVGNADPRALSVAVAGLQAVEAIGWPEGAITLAQVTTYLASAPKSNRSYLALKKAQELVKKTGSQPVPLALRSARTELTRELGYGQDYRYSHDYPRGWVEQNFWPEDLRPGPKLYEPSSYGFEKTLKDSLAWRKGQGASSPSEGETK